MALYDDKVSLLCGFAFIILTFMTCPLWTMMLAHGYIVEAMMFFVLFVFMAFAAVMLINDGKEKKVRRRW